MTGEERTYDAAGVSLATAGAVVERLRAAVESTGAEGFGAFAALHPLDERRLLAASTDSIGTKPMVARPRGLLRNCGADMAAHCINDVITCGAEPLVLLDYVAAARIELEQVAELIEGAAEVCRTAGVALIGGETAEMPDVYREDELDFAATCVGVVDRDALIDGSQVEAGDVVLGFPSAGVHANGFSLVRRVLEEEDYDGARPARADEALPRRRPEAARPGARVRARDRRRHPRQPRARPPRRPQRRDRLGRVGAPARLPLARPPRRGGGAAPRVQPRHRLVRGRAGGRARRACDRADRVIGVLVSGEGTNLQALIDAGLPIVAVASNKPGVRALERADAAGIETAVFDARDYESREERDVALAEWLQSHGVQLVVCAGYMHLFRKPFFDYYGGRIVNTHSAPLPQFPGAHPIEDVLAAGVDETAATVHYVDEGIDTGPVIAAERVPVLPDDTVDTLRARVQQVEHRLLPEVVRELCAR